MGGVVAHARRAERKALVLACAVGALLGAASALDPPDADAARARPSALVAYYPSDRLPAIVDGLDAARFPSGALVYFGNYSSQPRYGASALETQPGPWEVAGERYRYMPILQFSESRLWDGRRVSDEEAGTLARAGDGHLTGSFPTLGGILARPARERLRFGRELGRRFRDRFRERLADGAPIGGWQFDEVRTEVAGRSGRRYRDFTRGILEGLHAGRPALGDRPQRGLVHVSSGAFPLARAGLTSELRRFWRTMNTASIRFVGQEYPFFRGGARDAARRLASGQRSLARGGGDRAALSRRYMVGLTPGYIVTRSLGGNVDGRPRDWVNRWRNDYIRARAGMGVAGFGEFNFMPPNDRRWVIQDATRALGFGVRKLW